MKILRLLLWRNSVDLRCNICAYCLDIWKITVLGSTVRHIANNPWAEIESTVQKHKDLALATTVGGFCSVGWNQINKSSEKVTWTAPTWFYKNNSHDRPYRGRPHKQEKLAGCVLLLPASRGADQAPAEIRLADLLDGLWSRVPTSVAGGKTNSREKTPWSFGI